MRRKWRRTIKQKNQYTYYTYVSRLEQTLLKKNDIEEIDNIVIVQAQNV